MLKKSKLVFLFFFLNEIKYVSAKIILLAFEISHFLKKKLSKISLKTKQNKKK